MTPPSGECANSKVKCPHCEDAAPSATQVVVKPLVSADDDPLACNMGCPGCYVHSGAAKVRSRPLSQAEVAQLAFRIGEHTRAYSGWPFHVTFHGGEPFYHGVGQIVSLHRLICEAVGDTAPLSFSAVTNGLFLKRRVNVERLAALDGPPISLIISVDGTREQHNNNRPFKNGAGTYDHVMTGIAVLCDVAPQLFRRILCTLDIAYPPIPTMQALLDVIRRNPYHMNLDPDSPEVMTFDLLMPHGTHDLLPPGKDQPGSPYADWLIEAMNWFYYQPMPFPPPIWGLMEGIMKMAAGACTSSSILYGGPVRNPLVVKGTKFTHLDTLEIIPGYDPTMRWPVPTSPDAPGINEGDVMTVDNVSLEMAALVGMYWNGEHGVGERYPDGRAVLAPKCMSNACGVRRECAGGLFVHRRSEVDDPARGLTRGYNNPTIYCEDMQRIVEAWRSILAASGRQMPPRKTLCGHPMGGGSAN